MSAPSGARTAQTLPRFSILYIECSLVNEDFMVAMPISGVDFDRQAMVEIPNNGVPVCGGIVGEPRACFPVAKEKFLGARWFTTAVSCTYLKCIVVQIAVVGFDGALGARYHRAKEELWELLVMPAHVWSPCG